MNNSLIHFPSSNRTPRLIASNINIFEDLFSQYSTSVYIFYTGEELSKTYTNELKSKWIIFFHYINSEEAQQKIQDIKKNSDYVFLNTFDENFINKINSLRKQLLQKTTDDSSLFTNKYKQRKLLLDYNPEITVKFIEDTIEKLQFSTLSSTLGTPFILKPNSWIQSSGVEIINNQSNFNSYVSRYNWFIKNLEERGYSNTLMLWEEFIDGKMYSIDYFVTQEWNIKTTLPVEIILWEDLNINDFCNISRNINSSVIEKLKNYDISDFILQTVRALNIRNTFIHHEFKITSKNKIKTIEVNGRAGGFRPEMIWLSCNKNLLSLFLDSQKSISKLVNNCSVILFYPTKKWILKWFNQDLIKQIKLSKSFYSMKMYENFIWKEIGLTKEWFWKVWILKLKGKDSSGFTDDYEFVIANYAKILILE